MLYEYTVFSARQEGVGTGRRQARRGFSRPGCAPARAACVLRREVGRGGKPANGGRVSAGSGPAQAVPRRLAGAAAACAVQRP
ncbi:hypothetical protein EFP20_11435 [Burkholderia glumae]|nr:hypothetical protein EFP17_29540 [Burkholderia glumae]UVT02188.1 hypothetical protein EFP20_11435 [Burkholderia glumae]